MTLTISIPRGVTRKQPPPNRGQADVSPPDPHTVCTLAADQGHSELNSELLRQMIERTECGNMRIRKLNEFRRQRRLDSAGLCDVSDSKDEELVPNISSYMAQLNNRSHITDPSNVATGSNAIDPCPCDINKPQSGMEDAENPQLGSSEWHALIDT